MKHPAGDPNHADWFLGMAIRPADGCVDADRAHHDLWHGASGAHRPAASLDRHSIIALGLLVDNPVVANDAIKRQLAAGNPPLIAAWLGPTKLARAILYATLTNIIAYLPFLMLTGSTGDFLHSLPIVMAGALISSRMVSTMFTPLLGYYLLRPPKKPEPSIEEWRTRGFYGGTTGSRKMPLRWRWAVIGVSLLFLASGAIVVPN